MVFARKRLSRNFGFEVPVLLKTSKELEQTIHDNPFLKAAAIDHSKLHVTFLSKAAAKNLETLVMNGEQFYVNGQEIYLYSQMRMAEPNFPTLPSRRSWGSKRPQETGIQSMRCLDWLSRITPGIKANTAKNQSIQEGQPPISLMTRCQLFSSSFVYSPVTIMRSLCIPFEDLGEQVRCGRSSIRDPLRRKVERFNC